MEITERMAVASEAEKTRKNFPITRSMREMGLERMVSIVPRSFSPAVRSIAGYIAPVMHKIITVYPMKLPNVAAYLFRRRHILLFNRKWRQHGRRQMLRRKPILNHRIAIILQEFFQPVRPERRLYFPVIEIDLDRFGLSGLQRFLKSFRNFNSGANVLVRNLVLPVGRIGHDFQALQLLDFRNQ